MTQHKANEATAIAAMVPALIASLGEDVGAEVGTTTITSEEKEIKLTVSRERKER